MLSTNKITLKGCKSKVQFLEENPNFTGEITVLYRNGDKEEICNYKNGLLHGQCTEFTNTGKLWEKAYYYNNQRHGKTEMWDALGNKIADADYARDLWLNGSWVNEISPKSYRKPKFTLSLNYARYS